MRDWNWISIRIGHEISLEKVKEGTNVLGWFPLSGAVFSDVDLGEIRVEDIFDVVRTSLGDRGSGHTNDGHDTHDSGDVLRFCGDVGRLEAVDEAGLRFGQDDVFGGLLGHGFTFRSNEWSFSI